MSTPEFELLLACARTVPDPGRIQQLVRQKLDWSAFWDLATHHNVRPLALRSMQMTCWIEVPEQYQREWQEALRILNGRSLFLMGELIGIVQSLEHDGIQVCVLKGLLYGQILYGDVMLRETSDFDLLIREEDLRRATKVFEDLGYRPHAGVKIEQLTELLKYVGEYPFLGDGKLVDIDLHWRLSNKPLALAPDLSDFPLSPQRFTLANSLMQSIAIEELPLYLATQGGNDSWNDLRRITDLAEYLRRFPHTDWRPVIATARRHHAELIVFVGLQLAVNLLGATLPGDVAAELEHIPATQELASAVERRMREQQSPGSLQRHVFQIQAKSGIGEKGRLLWSILTDRMAADAWWIHLPQFCWWLYRLLRPIRMVLKLGSTE